MGNRIPIFSHGAYLFEREEGGERVQRVMDEVVRTDARAAELQIRLDDRRRQLDAVGCAQADGQSHSAGVENIRVEVVGETEPATFFP
jgi:hypothetical protein